MDISWHDESPDLISGDFDLVMANPGAVDFGFEAGQPSLRLPVSAFRSVVSASSVLGYANSYEKNFNARRRHSIGSPPNSSTTLEHTMAFSAHEPSPNPRQSLPPQPGNTAVLLGTDEQKGHLAEINHAKLTAEQRNDEPEEKVRAPLQINGNILFLKNALCIQSPTWDEAAVCHSLWFQNSLNVFNMLQ